MKRETPQQANKRMLAENRKLARKRKKDRAKLDEAIKRNREKIEQIKHEPSPFDKAFQSFFE